MNLYFGMNDIRLMGHGEYEIVIMIDGHQKYRQIYYVLQA